MSIVKMDSLKDGYFFYPYNEETRLRHVDFNKNPIRNVPLATIENGWEEIKNYFRSIEEKSITSFLTARVFVLGETEVGKTSIIKKMIDSANDDDDLKEESTRGVSITQWDFPINGNELFKARLWEFDGNSRYRNRPQFFLTKRSLYLIVCDARKGEESSRLDYWLNIIKITDNNSPILIVINKYDRWGERINENAYKERFPNIQGFHKVNCVNGLGINELREAIKEKLIFMPHATTKFPEEWKEVLKILSRDKNDFISIYQYNNLCYENFISKKWS